MPLGLRRGLVTALVEAHERLIRLEVDGIACVAYPWVTGPLEVGDDVLVNERARLLELGSGGFDVLYANLTRGLGLPAEEGAHVMALPYTPGQVAVRFDEESAEVAESLEGLPVVLCTLHSQVAPACAALSGLRVAYVQVGGGALPVSLSDTVRELKGRGLVDVACAVAPCLDADAQFVTAAAALAWACAEGYDVVICSVGPGIVGTASRFGHGALELADVANAAIALAGRPVLAVRTSGADARARHRGVSHHARAVLDFTLGQVVVAAERDGVGWEEACAGLPLSHMGRGPADDPAFFRSAYAAGVAARRLVPGGGAAPAARE
ncbi:MAG TPA: DUF3866 family protein [Gaiellaceae bacterium]|nr:DUF3866 family protein [Gaiellaceae bacterium]